MNDQLEILNNGLFFLFDRYVPTKNKVINKCRKINPWYSRGVVNIHSLRDYTFKAYREEPSRDCRRTDSKYRNKVTNMVKQAKRKYAAIYYSADQPTSTLWKK